MRIAMALIATFVSCMAAPAAAGDKPHAVIVVGTPHYSPQNSMPVLARELERHGFRTTVIIPPGDPERNRNGVGIPGLEALEDADVAILFMRFLALPKKQFRQVMDYVESGGPVVGFRTSTHAFGYPDDHPLHRWNNGFGRKVLGTSYIVHQTGETECRIVEKHAGHPVLTGVGDGPFTSTGSLYLTALQPGCVPLVIGTGRRQGERLVENFFGTFYIREVESDIVAWTWTNRWGGRVFCSSFGHVGDFAVAPIMRTVVNGICWAADHPAPGPDASIGTYEVEVAEAN